MLRKVRGCSVAIEVKSRDRGDAHPPTWHVTVPGIVEVNILKESMIQITYFVRKIQSLSCACVAITLELEKAVNPVCEEDFG